MDVLAHCWTIYVDDARAEPPMLRKGHGHADIGGWHKLELVSSAAHTGAVAGVAAWLREQATGERTEDPGSDQLELIADFIEREHPQLGGQ